MKNKLMNDLIKKDKKERDDYQKFIKLKAKGDWINGAKMWAAAKRRPADDLFNDKFRLKRFMSMKFEFESFDTEDWDNYWLLAQHCDFNPQFQKKALENIKKYLGTKHNHFKYLSDRISMQKTGRQRYNTQNM